MLRGLRFTKPANTDNQWAIFIVTVIDFSRSQWAVKLCESRAMVYEEPTESGAHNGTQFVNLSVLACENSPKMDVKF